MEEFLHNAKLLISTLGHKAFEPLLEEEEKTDDAQTLYWAFSSREGDSGKATGKRTNEGFVLIKGSKINSVMATSAPKGALKMREQYKNVVDKNFVTTIRKAVIANQTNGNGYGILSPIAQNAVQHDHDLILRPNYLTIFCGIFLVKYTIVISLLILGK